MNVEWLQSESPVGYEEAVAFMESRVEQIALAKAPPAIWLLEHPPLYTAGTGAREDELLKADFPVYYTGRGGKFTYHGPGQRVCYVMMDLRQSRDVRKFVHALEEWVIRILARLGVKGERREGRVGIWVVKPDGEEAKIASLGIRVRKWVSFHGIAINVNPNLSHFKGIVPCGIRGYGITSLEDLGVSHDMREINGFIKGEFHSAFKELLTD